MTHPAALTSPPHLIACALVALVGCGSSQRKATDRMLELNRAALADLKKGRQAEARKHLLEAERVGEEAGMTDGAVVARTQLALGSVYSASPRDRKKAVAHMSRALAADPAVRLGSTLGTPAARRALAAAKAERAAALKAGRSPEPPPPPVAQREEREVRPPPPPPPPRDGEAPGGEAEARETRPCLAVEAAQAGAAPSAGGDARGPSPRRVPNPPPRWGAPGRRSGPRSAWPRIGAIGGPGGRRVGRRGPTAKIPICPRTSPQDLYCPVPEQTPPDEPLTLRCVLRPGVRAGRLTLHYRPAGSESFTDVPMARSRKGWYRGVVPASAATGKTLQYYVEGSVAPEADTAATPTARTW